MSNKVRFLGLMADSKARVGRVQDVPGRSCGARKCSKTEGWACHGAQKQRSSSHGQSWNGLSDTVHSVVSLMVSVLWGQPVYSGLSYWHGGKESACSAGNWVGEMP